MNATITVPGSPRTMYVQLREQGEDHGKAAAKVAHAYGRSVSDMSWLPNARDEWEAAQTIEPEQAPPVETPGEPDPFAEKEAAARAEIVRLTDLRASLALDALSDPSKADELASVERELQGAERGLAWAEEARREDGRRKLADADEQAQAARGDALRRAGELQTQRAKAAARVDAAMTALANSLAAHQEISMAQGQTLAALDGYGLERVLVPGWALADAFACALNAASAPAGWCELGLTREPRPLAETDRRPVEPVETSPKSKGK